MLLKHPQAATPRGLLQICTVRLHHQSFCFVRLVHCGAWKCTCALSTQGKEMLLVQGPHLENHEVEQMLHKARVFVYFTHSFPSHRAWYPTVIQVPNFSVTNPSVLHKVILTPIIPEWHTQKELFFLFIVWTATLRPFLFLLTSKLIYCQSKKSDESSWISPDVPVCLGEGMTKLRLHLHSKIFTKKTNCQMQVPAFCIHLWWNKWSCQIIPIFKK